MHIPWRRIFTGAEAVLTLASPFVPQLAAIQAVIHGVESAVSGQGQGAQKKAIVQAAGMAMIESQLAGLTTEQQTAVAASLSAFIDAYVASQNAYESLLAAITAVKHA